jgi:Ca-activated chloride channel family protein
MPPEQAVENDEARETTHTPGNAGPERHEAPAQTSGAASEQVAASLSMQRSHKLLAQDAARPVPQPLDPNIVWPVEPTDRENYAALDDNPVRLVHEHPVSTFSIDVDTGAYANVRRFLNQGRLPPTDAVRIEELINYFSYDYPLPRHRETPFSISTEMAAAPWNDEALLLSVGIRGYELDAEQRPPANLVFLLDVSGSMNSQDKLPLLKNAFRLLTRRLTGDDRVSIVVYAGASGLVLEPTAGDEQARILAALDRLHAGGSTNGGDGIRLAYSVAADAFIEEGINRVILATDGDFNVGTVNHESLIDLIERQRDKGIALTTLGFGQGNYNDHLLEQLADHGNGNYAYIDTLNEARKVLVEELASTLLTIARDVKIQIEFNPALVAEYRLIGYENRMLRREDFNNDRVDAGDIGAGHTVTALYELKLVGSGSLLVDPLRYGAALSPKGGDKDELGHFRLRYKAPGADTSRLIERSLLRSDLRRLDDTSDDFRFAAAVAGFGQSLRGGRYLGDYSLDGVAELARDARGDDPHGYRSEFISLVALAQSIDPSDRVAAR